MTRRCDIVHTAVQEGPPYYVDGPYRAVSHCRTHGMEVPGPGTELPISEGEQLCPIGKIEKAVDDGLAKIAAAIDQRLP